MDQAYVYLIIGSVCGLLLWILFLLIVINCLRRRNNQHLEAEIERQTADNQMNESISMAAQAQMMNSGNERQIDRGEDTDYTAQEQVFQICPNTPPLEPSAPPLPPEYFMEYT